MSVGDAGVEDEVDEGADTSVGCMRRLEDLLCLIGCSGEEMAEGSWDEGPTPDAASTISPFLEIEDAAYSRLSARAVIGGGADDRGSEETSVGLIRCFFLGFDTDADGA